MNLTSGEVAVVLVACAVVIGAIFVLYRRGIFGGTKVEQKTPVTAAKE